MLDRLKAMVGMFLFIEATKPRPLAEGCTSVWAAIKRPRPASVAERKIKPSSTTNQGGQEHDHDRRYGHDDHHQRQLHIGSHDESLRRQKRNRQQHCRHDESESRGTARVSLRTFLYGHPRHLQDFLNLGRLQCFLHYRWRNTQARLRSSSPTSPARSPPQSLKVRLNALEAEPDAWKRRLAYSRVVTQLLQHICRDFFHLCPRLSRK